MQSKCCVFLAILHLYYGFGGATITLHNPDSQAKSLGLLGFIKGLQFGKVFQHKQNIAPAYWQAVLRIEFQPMQFGGVTFPQDCPFGCPYYPVNGFPVAPPRPPKPSYDSIPLPSNDDPTGTKNPNDRTTEEDSDETIETFDIAVVQQNTSDRIIRNIAATREANDDFDENGTTEGEHIITTIDENTDDTTTNDQTSTMPSMLSTILLPVEHSTNFPQQNDPSITTAELQPMLSSPISVTTMETKLQNDLGTTTSRSVLATTTGYGEGAPKVAQIFFTTLKPPFGMEPVPVWYTPSVTAWSAFRPSRPDFNANSDYFLPVAAMQRS